MKVALVTGAYKGLGYAWCKKLNNEGYEVILTARTVDKATEAARTLNAEGSHVHPYALDVTNEQELNQLAVWIQNQFGKLDLIINNAGVNPKDYTDKEKMAKAFYLDYLDADELLEVIRINSIAPLLVVKHMRSLLKKSMQPLVINISSWLGSVSQLQFGGHYGYVGSKNLLNVLNKSMANELKQDGIICINVNPGWVQTDMGGARATFTSDESVSNIYHHIVSGIDIAQTGQFLNFDGAVHPW